MNDSIQLQQVCLKIQEIDRDIALAKLNPNYKPGVLERQRDSLYSLINMDGTLPNDYRQIAHTAYLYKLAEMFRYFEQYGTSTTVPVGALNITEPCVNQDKVINNAAIAAWFGNDDYSDVILKFRDEITFITKYVQRFRPESRNIINFAVKLRMQLRACKTLEETTAVIKQLKRIVVTPSIKSYLTVPGGLLQGPEIYWTNIYPEAGLKYTVPWIPVVGKATDNDVCPIIKARDLKQAATTIQNCYSLLQELAQVYEEIKTYRRFDDPDIFPLNPELMQQVLVCPNIDNEERFILFNYTNAGFVYMYFRFFTDCMLRYRRIADELTVLFQASIEV